VRPWVQTPVEPKNQPTKQTNYIHVWTFKSCLQIQEAFFLVQDYSWHYRMSSILGPLPTEFQENTTIILSKCCLGKPPYSVDELTLCSLHTSGELHHNHKKLRTATPNSDHWLRTPMAQEMSHRWGFMIEAWLDDAWLEHWFSPQYPQKMTLICPTWGWTDQGKWGMRNYSQKFRDKCCINEWLA
jgi:hypothetical protein